MITNSFYNTKFNLNRNLSEVQLQCSEIESKLEETPVAIPLLHLNLPAIYQDKTASLLDALNKPDTIAQANEAIRQFIERVRLMPGGNTLNIELVGEMAAPISLGIGPNDKYPLANAGGCN